jgi:hypothetical protein
MCNLCSKRFGFRQGRLYCCPMQPVDGSPPANTHSVEHHWLCGSCSKIYTFEPRAGFGVVITPRSTAHQKVNPGRRFGSPEPPNETQVPGSRLIVMWEPPIPS